MSGITALTPQDVKKQIEELAGKENLAPDYINLFSELFVAEYEDEQRLEVTDIYPPVPMDEIKRRLAEALPVIDPAKINISEAALVELLAAIVPALKEHAAVAGSIAVKLLAETQSGRVDLRELIRSIVAGNMEYLEEISRAMEAETDELFFVASVLARPVLRVIARKLWSKAESKDASGDHCPVCGGAPLMGRLEREIGQRFVECSLCGTEWPVKRIRCLACGNEDGDSLGYIYIDGDACRIDKCEKCHTYIKTLDERKKPENQVRALCVEDIATLHLDLLAEERGYHSLR